MSRPAHPLLFQVAFHRFAWRLLILFCSLTAAITGLLAPWFQKEFIDLLTGQRSPFDLGWFTTPTPWIWLAFIAMITSQGLAQLTNYLGAREAIELQGVFARQLYDKMLSLRADTMSRRPLGEVVSLYATDVPGATVFLDQTLPMGASTVFPLVLTPFALITLFDTPLWGTIILMVFVTLVNSALALRQSKFFYRFKQLAAERIGLVNEWIQSIRALRILGWTAAFESAIFEKREVETDNRVRMVTNGQLMNSVSTSVTFLLNIVTLGSLVLWSRKQLTPGEILALLWIVGVFLTRPFRQMPWFFTFMFDAWTSLKRLQIFLDTENPVTLPAAKALPPPVEGAVLEVRGLRLQSAGTTLLEGVDVILRPREFVAVVGEVGSGKTLLLLSLLRETGAAFDRYLLNGRDAMAVTDEELRANFALVPQEGFIMSANLRDNVIFDYDTDATKNDEVLRSLKMADFDPVRERVENGLETEIGERGVNLSGGQRQRVSLARVHAADARIVLLDDCLSAVDVDTENKIVDVLLTREWADRARLLVTHRLTVLDKVDRILFLKDGRLIGDGTLAELSRDSAEFREFTASVRRLQEETAPELKPPAAVPPLTEVPDAE